MVFQSQSVQAGDPAHLCIRFNFSRTLILASCVTLHICFFDRILQFQFYFFLFFCICDVAYEAILQFKCSSGGVSYHFFSNFFFEGEG